MCLSYVLGGLRCLGSGGCSRLYSRHCPSAAAAATVVMLLLLCTWYCCIHGGILECIHMIAFTFLPTNGLPGAGTFEWLTPSPNMGTCLVIFCCGVALLLIDCVHHDGAEYHIVFLGEVGNSETVLGGLLELYTSQKPVSTAHAPSCCRNPIAFILAMT